MTTNNNINDRLATIEAELAKLISHRYTLQERWYYIKKLRRERDQLKALKA